MYCIQHDCIVGLSRLTINIFLCDCNSVLLSAKKNVQYFLRNERKLHCKRFAQIIVAFTVDAVHVFDETNNVPESSVPIRHYCWNGRFSGPPVVSEGYFNTVLDILIGAGEKKTLSFHASYAILVHTHVEDVKDVSVWRLLVGRWRVCSVLWHGIIGKLYAGIQLKRRGLPETFSFEFNRWGLVN